MYGRVIAARLTSQREVRKQGSDWTTLLIRNDGSVCGSVGGIYSKSCRLNEQNFI
jgi:hypothetical protein